MTRMTSEGVPNDVGMRITGHKSQSAYAMYDRNSEVHVRAVVRCAAEDNGTGSEFKSKLVDEAGNFSRVVLEGGIVHKNESGSPPRKRGRDSLEACGVKRCAGVKHCTGEYHIMIWSQSVQL